MTRCQKLVPALLAFVGLAACVTGGPTVQVTTEAKGSDYFSLSAPGAYKDDAGLRLTGRVCRLRRSTLLSPPTIRVEHISASGEVINTARASAPVIYSRYDQACSSYSARVDWSLGDGETLRACFDHGRACPATAAVKAVVAAPAQ